MLLSEIESNALYSLAGWAVFKEKKSLDSCAICLDSICSLDKNPEPFFSKLTCLKSYQQGCGLTHPSKAIFKAVIAAESIFITYQDKIAGTGNVLTSLW